LQIEARFIGNRAECPQCGQWFIAGKGGPELPVVEPRVVGMGPAEFSEVPLALLVEKGVQAADEVRSGKPETGQKWVSFPPALKSIPGSETAQGGEESRKCAACNSSMHVAYGEDNVMELPGSKTCWMCDRCGKEIKLRNLKRILVLVALTPLLFLWCFVFFEAHRHHGAGTALWLQGMEEFALDGSKKRVAYYVLFLVLTILAPLALLQEVIIRLRYSKIR
jgi:hypothetical protein